MPTKLSSIIRLAAVAYILLAPVREVKQSVAKVRWRCRFRRVANERQSDADCKQDIPEVENVESAVEPRSKAGPQTKAADEEEPQPRAPSGSRRYSPASTAVSRPGQSSEDRIGPSNSANDIPELEASSTPVFGAEQDDIQNSPSTKAKDEDQAMSKARASYSSRSKEHNPEINPAKLPSTSREAKTRSKKKLLYTFNMSRIALQNAEDSLYHREEYFDEQRQELDEKAEAGEDVKSPEEIDMDELRETQRMTRRLIDAEKQHEAAKTALIEADIQPPGSDVESGFVDDVDDGYRLSLERELAESVSPVGIFKWLDGVENETDSEASCDEDVRGKMDEWSAKEVGVSDSWSLVADGARRRRIDRWRALAGAWRSDEV